MNEDIIIFTKKNAGKTVDTLEMDRKKWKAIAETVETLKLKEFPYLVAPSDRRKYDGEAHTKLKIYFKGKLYEFAGFDDGNPRETIKELVEMVTELRPD